MILLLLESFSLSLNTSFGFMIKRPGISPWQGSLWEVMAKYCNL